MWLVDLVQLSNKLAWFSVLEVLRHLSRFEGRRGGGLEVEGRWRSRSGLCFTPVAVLEWLRRQPWRLAAGRLHHTTHPLAEGRPNFFLPAKEPKGRQCILSMESATRCHGGLVVPSGDIPGDGEAASVGEMLRTRSRFSSSCWGSLYKSQGPVCNLGLVFGPFVSCCIPPLEH